MPINKLFKTPYQNNHQSMRVSKSFLDEDGNQKIGRTEQHHKSDVDINNILRKYDKTGLIVHVNKAVADYGDYTEVNEYKENLNAVMNAQNMFNELPSHIRKRFANDPGEFIEFVTNPDNAQEMVDLGLADAVVEEGPIEVRVLPDSEYDKNGVRTRPISKDDPIEDERRNRSNR
jgi:phage internal scaffolding protein